ncbi:unnamed protein product [Peniophora sp. CBMAI 1063]|nr:unnamed protein product [Peniophora sp. CBMAI 1063]
MFARLFILAVLFSFTAAQINISTPTGSGDPIQCEVYTITWSGGTAPYNILLLDSGKTLVEQIALSATRSPVTWVVDQPPNTIFVFSITDKNDVSATSGRFTILPSSAEKCAAAESGARTTVFGPSATGAGSALPSSSRPLSKGAIAALAVGAVCAVLFVIGGVGWVVVRRFRRVTSAVLEEPEETIPSVLVTTVEPFPFTTPENFTWERKNRQGNGSRSAAEANTASGVEEVVDLVVAAEALPGTGEISERTVDRLVNLVLRRLHAQEAPPSYPASSPPGSDG